MGFGSFRLSLWMDGSYLLDFYDCCSKNAQILSLLILLNDLPSPPDSGTKIFFLAFVSEPLDLAFYRTLHFFCFLHFIHFAASSFVQIHFFAICMILQICLHTWYLSFFLHWQNFWRIKFTPKKRVNYDKIHSKLPIFALLRQNKK